MAKKFKVKGLVNFVKNLVNRNKHSAETHSEVKPQIENNFNSQGELTDFKNSQRIQEIFDAANERINQLTNYDGLQSKALNQLAYERGVDMQHDDITRLDFDVESITNMRDAISQLTQAEVFLADPTSTLKGAEEYSNELRQSKWVGQFGNEFNTADYGFKRYNTNVINDEIAAVAFEAYRRLEENIGDIREVYGSDNAIALLYDYAMELGAYTGGDDELQAEFAREVSHDVEEIIRNHMSYERRDLDSELAMSRQAKAMKYKYTGRWE